MGDKPNIFLVDVPPEEKQAVEKIIFDSGVNLLGNAPIVQMRLTEIKGRPITELVGKKTTGEHHIPKWILRREFRSTYRETPSETEKVIALLKWEK